MNDCCQKLTRTDQLEVSEYLRGQLDQKESELGCGSVGVAVCCSLLVFLFSVIIAYALPVFLSATSTQLNET